MTVQTKAPKSTPVRGKKAKAAPRPPAPEAPAYSLVTAKVDFRNIGQQVLGMVPGTLTPWERGRALARVMADRPEGVRVAEKGKSKGQVTLGSALAFLCDLDEEACAKLRATTIHYLRFYEDHVEGPWVWSDAEASWIEVTFALWKRTRVPRPSKGQGGVKEVEPSEALKAEVRASWPSRVADALDTIEAWLEDGMTVSENQDLLTRINMLQARVAPKEG